MNIAIKDLAQLLGGTIKGDENATVNNVSKIEEGKPGTIAFLANPKYEQFVYTTQATAVLVRKDFEAKKEYSTNLIYVEDPYSCITVLLEEYERIEHLQLLGREEPAFIHPSSEIGDNEYIAAFAYIGKNVKIGNNVKIYPQVYIGDNVKIGDNCILLPGTKILQNTLIGSHNTFFPNCVIGSDGFGFAPQKDGTYKRIPQVGNVTIGDHCSIGSGTTIDCATMGSTVIGNGVKLDNLIQIGHNVEIGDNTVMAAHAAIGGSTKVGKNCIIGGKVGVVGHIKLAERTTIAASSMILKDSKPGEKLFGFVAFDHLKALKSTSLFKSLPEINDRVKQLEEKVLNLTSV